MNILKTKDYNQFKTVISNREVNRLHVDKLAASLKKKNLMWAKPALVNESLDVIDGQHRLEACRVAKEEFHYIKAAGLTKDDIAVLNTNQKNWTTMDFLNFYAIEGYKPYKELCNLINKFPRLKVTMIMSLAGNREGIKDGKFTGSGLARARVVCGWIMTMDQVKYPFVVEKAFGQALHSVCETAEEFAMMAKRANANNFFKCHSQPEYVKVIKTILKD